MPQKWKNASRSNRASNQFGSRTAVTACSPRGGGKFFAPQRVVARQGADAGRWPALREIRPCHSVSGKRSDRLHRIFRLRLSTSEG